LPLDLSGCFCQPLPTDSQSSCVKCSTHCFNLLLPLLTQAAGRAGTARMTRQVVVAALPVMKVRTTDISWFGWLHTAAGVQSMANSCGSPAVVGV
jgi:hypothetical protein